MESSSVNSSRKLLCYRKLINLDPWFVYWIPDEEILGITDGMKKLFESKVTIADRKEILGNVAESLVSNKWNNLFENRAFEFEFPNDVSVEVSYITRSKILKSVDEESRYVRISRILELFVEETNLILVCLNYWILCMEDFQKKLQEFEKEKALKSLDERAKKRAQYSHLNKPKVL